MSVIVKCKRNYGKSDLTRIIESCGCCPPKELHCPPLCTPCPPERPIICCSPCSEQTPNRSTATPIALYPPQPCTLACPLRPFMCRPCTGYPCIPYAPLPKPVPAPFEFGPVTRTRIATGGLFYTGTVRCYPCMPPVC